MFEALAGSRDASPFGVLDVQAPTTRIEACPSRTAEPSSWSRSERVSPDGRAELMAARLRTFSLETTERHLARGPLNETPFPRQASRASSAAHGVGKTEAMSRARRTSRGVRGGSSGGIGADRREDAPKRQTPPRRRKAASTVIRSMSTQNGSSPAAYLREAISGAANAVCKVFRGPNGRRRYYGGMLACGGLDHAWDTS